jgi:hypothetical protein
MPKLMKFALVSSLALLCSACAKNMPTVVEAGSLCRDWRPYRPAKGDQLTEKSAAELLANNESRVVWGCHKTKNEAA